MTCRRVGAWMAVLALTAGCAGTGGSAAQGSREIADMEGRKVALQAPDQVRRAAVLTSPAVQIMFVLGVQDRLCAVTQAVKRWPLLAQFDARITRVPAVRSGAGQVNIEALLATRPDVALGSALDLRSVETGTAIPTLRLAAGTAANFTRQITDEVVFLGRVFGREERARASLEWLQAARGRVRAGMTGLDPRARQTVFMGFGPDHLTTFGASTFMHEWIEAAGCRNAAGEIPTAGGKEGGLAQVSMEQVLRWAPDVVVLDEGSAAALEGNAQWRSVPAVRNHRVYRLPTGVFIWNRASFESAALLPTWLAIQAYPDRFRQLSMDAEAKRFYAETFGFRLGDDQLRAILHPEAR